MITFAYAVVCLVEGTGLMLEKRWAEYFTVTLTALALPLECFELYKQFTSLRIGLLLLNLVVLGYLIWLLRRQRRRETTPGACLTRTCDFRLNFAISACPVWASEHLVKTRRGQHHI